MTPSSLSVLHILPGLTVGGTELTVFHLAQKERNLGINSQVLSLKGIGPLGQRFEEAAIPAQSLKLIDVFGGLARWVWPSRKMVRSFDIIDGWLYSGNLAAGVLALGSKGSGLIWNLMQANLSPTVNGLKTRLLMKAGARLSGRWPDRIVCNSVAAREAHRRLGFNGSKMRIIPNGIDTETFRPLLGARARFCAAAGVSSSSIILGHLARWDPQKDHRTLVQAIGLLNKNGVNAHLFLAGPGVTKENALLMKWVQETGVSERFHLLGSIDDASRFLAGLDIFCLSSVGESSSYALAEAMACGVPAVVTDVGDSRALLGESGVVVRPSDPDAFCAGLQRLVAMGPEGRSRLGETARDRIVRDYSFLKMVDAYQGLYQEILRDREK